MQAKDNVDVLWAYGLVYFSNIISSTENITQHCVEVHAVISQYIVQCIDSYEVNNLLSDCTKAISQQIRATFQQSCGVHDPLSLAAIDFLKYKLSEIENSGLPYYVPQINQHASSS